MWVCTEERAWALAPPWNPQVKALYGLYYRSVTRVLFEAALIRDVYGGGLASDDLKRVWNGGSELWELGFCFWNEGIRPSG